MKKNDIFTFTAPNGVEVTAIVVNQISDDYIEDHDAMSKEWLCYAQNRLFTFYEMVGRKNAFTPKEEAYLIDSWYGRILVEYCIIPEYDEMLEDYYHQLDLADDYADKTL
jgi:hypothetical protein